MTDGLPDLSLLSMKPRSALFEPTVGDGVYCLDSLDDDVGDCKSSIILVRGALPLTDKEFTELDEFMSDDERVPRTPNPMNRKFFLLRKQATFGANYNFGQKNVAIDGPPSEWPVAVQRALEVAKRVAAQKKLEPSLYNAVHANLYPDGRAGVAPHADQEGEMVRRMPILSFTLLAGEKKPRNFSIFLPKQPGEQSPEKVADVLLGHGDLLIMQGSMQSYFLHGVEAAKPPKAFANARRLNLTVRAFKQAALVRPRDDPKEAAEPETKEDESASKRARNDKVGETSEEAFADEV